MFVGPYTVRILPRVVFSTRFHGFQDNVDFVVICSFYLFSVVDSLLLCLSLFDPFSSVKSPIEPQSFGTFP